MSKQTPETAEKAAIKQWLCLRGWFHFPLVAGFASYPGQPDILAIKDGKVLAIEVKANGGRQSPKQAAFQCDWELHGGQYVLGGFDQVKLAVL